MPLCLSTFANTTFFIKVFLSTLNCSFSQCFTKTKYFLNELSGFILYIHKYIVHFYYTCNSRPQKSSFKIYMSMVFSNFIKLCNHYHYLIPEHSHQPTKNTSTYQQPHPFLPSLSPWQKTILLPASMDLPILGSPYRCKHPARSHQQLASLIQLNVFKVYHALVCISSSFYCKMIVHFLLKCSELCLAIIGHFMFRCFYFWITLNNTAVTLMYQPPCRTAYGFKYI